MTDDRIRLQKYLSMCAVASRRKAEELIAQGKVKVNGKVAEIGDKVSPRHDTVTVSGRKIAANKKHYYIMLHKPRGFITTMDDEMGRKCVAELVSDVGARVYPVGRLDKDSEGLLLMTNDGEFANHMTHPSKHIPKTYRVTVRPDVTEEMLTAFATGMEIDGRITAPADAHIIEKQDNRVVLEIVLYEGRNRQIRKMCEALGLEVARLKRTSMGSLKLGMLHPGKWRELTEDEVHKLMVSSGMKVNKF
ncbi:MAG TPA: pseudouridine synthase [Ruminococcaceae bacterium]|nr:pseudouridine synthase [Oscillospiraceae bacterium]HCT16828.1 pseudouridine synthase [Oscillospiraceae bacterium]